VNTLDEGGTILGQFPSACYKSFARRVEPGSRLLLYTDGVTEAVSLTGEFFGRDRLTRLMVSHSDTNVDQFADVVIDTITRWRGGAKLDDDVTIVVADIQGDRASGAEIVRADEAT
jgi:sigma-B regulation protein RsbU (phosphoserine phosphatase)